MKSFYTKIYWYLVYGRFKGRWLRIQYQILKIQNGGSNMAAWSEEKYIKFNDFNCYYLYRGFWGRWLRI